MLVEMVELESQYLSDNISVLGIMDEPANLKLQRRGWISYLVTFSLSLAVNKTKKNFKWHWKHDNFLRTF